MAFGLNFELKIMSTFLKTNLGKVVKAAISSYIDAILVDKITAIAAEMISHLNKFELIAKQPEPLGVGAVL